MLKYRVIPVTPYQQNCSLVWCDQTLQAAVIDPGGDLDRIHSAIEQAGVTPVAIWLTHGHLDHVGGTPQLASELSLPIIGPHKEDDFWLASVPDQAKMMGFPTVVPFQPTRWLDDGDTLTLGELTFQVIHCPGHTPGHVVLFEPQSKLAFVGDVLFAGSIGRTDFPRGNYDDLVHSIRGKLWPLGEEVQFVPGHGPMSTFGQEKRSNPFVADKNFG
ncbi:MBL fold metallo-hydrolase [Halioxenophilus sp. WMMB6]|uniref:MBL fold metallo-hydrolase n=1 Tax=Halioxenophilus sp. WMMB6 TaxID=3073815 RepID=UPI00295F2BC6|nr:MBL fold metallo-hydrolase [Halioxenophilus sp. WMMB6]